MLMRLAAFILAAALPSLAAAQAWPSKPVKMIVPFPAGGPTDVLTRALADKLSASLGQSVVVENKPGAGGAIGSDLVAKSAPDGYTLLMATSSTHSVGPNLVKTPYDPQKDFTPIVWVGTGTQLLVISPTLGVSTLRELIELARRDPGKLNYATSGVGSVAHLTSELFASTAGVRITHVPYKGLQQAIPDLMSGQVAMMFDNVLTGKPHVEGGRLKAVGVAALSRSKIMPDVPTLGEAGLPAFDASILFGLYGPAGTPQAVVERVNVEMNRILTDPSIKERFVQLGFETSGSTPAEFAAMMLKDSQKWARVIREANVKPE